MARWRLGITWLLMSLVEVWVAGLDDAANLAADYLPMLSPDEVEKARRFAFPHLRDEYILGRGLTRRILGELVELDARRIRFRYTERGKPSLEHRPDLHFNVSHSLKLLICATTLAGPIGADVERVREIRDARGIAERFFCAEEWRTLDMLPEALRPHAFFECWTRKEAFLKATGEGLTRNLDSVEVSFGPGSTPGFVRIENPPDDPAAWSLESFIPAENYVAAVTVRAPIRNLRICRIDCAAATSLPR